MNKFLIDHVPIYLGVTFVSFFVAGAGVPKIVSVSLPYFVQIEEFKEHICKALETYSQLPEFRAMRSVEMQFQHYGATSDCYRSGKESDDTGFIDVNKIIHRRYLEHIVEIGQLPGHDDRMYQESLYQQDPEKVLEAFRVTGHLKDGQKTLSLEQAQLFKLIYGLKEPNCNRTTSWMSLVDTERKELMMGQLSDLHFANEFFLVDHRSSLQSMTWLQAAKDRIRWLSTQLKYALDANRNAASAKLRLEELAKRMDGPNKSEVLRIAQSLEDPHQQRKGRFALLSAPDEPERKLDPGRYAVVGKGILSLIKNHLIRRSEVQPTAKDMLNELDAETFSFDQVRLKDKK
jgi:hypothetical protein